MNKLKLPKKLISTLQENSAHIISLRVTIVLLTSALMFSLYALYKAPKELIVRIPPDLSNGAVMNAGDYPKSRVLVDTAYLWIEINTWLQNGQRDAFENLDLWQHYLGHRFANDLRSQYNQLHGRGELLNRKRRVTLMPGTLSDAESRVIVKSRNQAWVVMLDVIVEDFYLGEPIQNVTVRFPLEVEVVETNVNQNPLGIKIIGMAGQAVVITENS